MKTFPTLYRRTKTGAIQEWKVWADGDTVYTEWGQENGTKQTSTTVATATNEGKANERNVDEQAVFDAGSLWRNKRDKGYTEDRDVAGVQIVYLPMLAHTAKNLEGLDTTFARIFIQPKLDGVRCLAYKEDGVVQLMSRGGKPYNVPHIIKELTGVLDENTILDGELYAEGKTCQDITSLVKKYKAGSENLVLKVFDIVDLRYDHQPFKERVLNMDCFFSNNLLKTVVKVPTTLLEPVKNEAIEAMHAQFLSEGLEGTIIRIPYGVYEWGARSRDLLKYKSFDDSEFEVLSVRAGLGKLAKAGIFTCANDNTKAVFDVVMAGTIEEREDHLANQTNYIGRKLTVKYFGRTNDGLPRFPVGIAFKEDR
jgi:DNA ligase-1